MLKINLEKYLFQIRTRHGGVVNNLKINGNSADEAKSKLMQMYPNCDILDMQIWTPHISMHSSFEDVIDLINSSEP